MSGRTMAGNPGACEQQNVNILCVQTWLAVGLPAALPPVLRRLRAKQPRSPHQAAQLLLQRPRRLLPWQPLYCCLADLQPALTEHAPMPEPLTASTNVLHETAVP